MRPALVFSLRCIVSAVALSAFLWLVIVLAALAFTS